MPSFAELHHRDLPLLLPNAWDVPSALALVAAGFEAVGTTSLGVASSLGRPDGARATRDANTALARALSTLDCHISMDVEDGYADDPEEVAGYVAALPVAGVNIEDSTAERLVPPAAYAAKVAAVKRRCPGIFVNARVDTYWLGQDATVESTVDRAARYVEAGADGVFVPGATAPDVLRELTAAIPVPEIVRRAEEVTKRLREFEALAVPGPVIDAIQARLPALCPAWPGAKVHYRDP